MSMINEYKEDLKTLRQQHRNIGDSNTNDKSQVASMIGSTEYSLFWLANGHERPTLDISPTRASKGNREQLWGEIEHAKGIEVGVCDVYFWDEPEEVVLSDKQMERMQDVTTIMRNLSNQELNIFIYKYQELLENEEIAELTGLTKKAVQRTIDRVSAKIESYFESKNQQLALFA